MGCSVASTRVRNSVTVNQVSFQSCDFQFPYFRSSSFFPSLFVAFQLPFFVFFVNSPCRCLFPFSPFFPSFRSFVHHTSLPFILPYFHLFSPCNSFLFFLYPFLPSFHFFLTFSDLPLFFLLVCLFLPSNLFLFLPFILFSLFFSCFLSSFFLSSYFTLPSVISFFPLSFSSFLSFFYPLFLSFSQFFLPTFLHPSLSSFHTYYHRTFHRLSSFFCFFLHSFVPSPDSLSSILSFLPERCNSCFFLRPSRQISKWHVYLCQNTSTILSASESFVK